MWFSPILFNHWAKCDGSKLIHVAHKRSVCSPIRPTNSLTTVCNSVLNLCWNLVLFWVLLYLNSCLNQWYFQMFGYNRFNLIFSVCLVIYDYIWLLKSKTGPVPKYNRILFVSTEPIRTRLIPNWYHTGNLKKSNGTCTLRSESLNTRFNRT